LDYTCELPLVVRIVERAAGCSVFDFLHLDALSNEITIPGLETLLVVRVAFASAALVGVQHERHWCSVHAVYMRCTA
jgi:hypothetical protein